MLLPCCAHACWLRSSPRVPMPRCSLWQSDIPVPDELHPLPNATTLLPELAQLQHLIRMDLDVAAPVAALPPEWAQPGAFPRLE